MNPSGTWDKEQRLPDWVFLWPNLGMSESFWKLSSEHKWYDGVRHVPSCVVSSASAQTNNWTPLPIKYMKINYLWKVKIIKNGRHQSRMWRNLSIGIYFCILPLNFYSEQWIKKDFPGISWVSEYLNAFTHRLLKRAVEPAVVDHILDGDGWILQILKRVHQDEVQHDVIEVQVPDLVRRTKYLHSCQREQWLQPSSALI